MRRACGQLLETARFSVASLAVPLLREDHIIGSLVVRRKSIGDFRLRSYRSFFENVRHPVSVSDPKRAAVPGDRGEKP